MSTTTENTGTAPGEKFYAIDDVLVQLATDYNLKISKSTFLNRVRAGLYPQPCRPTPRRPMWKQSDIEALIRSF